MPTIGDVARRAGVSPSTVSYVISGKRAISPGTRDRVTRAIKELGYHPHAGARSLASSRSATLGLMVPLRSDMYVPVIMEIVMAVAATARAHDHDVLLLTGDEGPDGVRRVAGNASTDALILMDVELDDTRVAVIRELATPAVCIGLPADPDGLSCIDLDFASAGALCADHLADLGHRDVAFIGQGEGVYRRHTGFADRSLEGFTSRAAGRGLRSVHRSCDGTFESTAGVLIRILEERPSTTGFVVQNEAALTPLLGLLRQLGRPVPEEISVVAVCPDQIAVHATPRVTSVSIPAERMGRGAVELAMAQLHGDPAAGAVLIPPTLTVRESSRRVGDPGSPPCRAPQPD